MTSIGLLNSNCVTSHPCPAQFSQQTHTGRIAQAKLSLAGFTSPGSYLVDFAVRWYGTIEYSYGDDRDVGVHSDGKGIFCQDFEDTRAALD